MSPNLKFQLHLGPLDPPGLWLPSMIPVSKPLMFSLLRASSHSFSLPGILSHSRPPSFWKIPVNPLRLKSNCSLTTSPQHQSLPREQLLSQDLGFLIHLWAVLSLEGSSLDAGRYQILFHAESQHSACLFDT